MTEQEFKAYWELLCERYGRAPSGPLERLYALTVRGAGLTTQEWGQAVAAAIRFDDFFPSAQTLIDYARPSFKAQALSEWDACMERMRRNEAATLPNTHTRTLINKITFGVPLGEITDKDRLPWVKKEFIERYTEHLIEQAKSATPALLPAARRELNHAG